MNLIFERYYGNSQRWFKLSQKFKRDSQRLYIHGPYGFLRNPKRLHERNNIILFIIGL